MFGTRQPGLPAPSGLWQAMQAGMPRLVSPSRYSFPPVLASLASATPGRRFCCEKYAPMSCMSCGASVAAMPCMIAFCRVPLLKRINSVTMYCSLWPASLGYCASLELPSMPWQAPQAAALAWPAVASPGLVATASSFANSASAAFAASPAPAALAGAAALELLAGAEAAGADAAGFDAAGMCLAGGADSATAIGAVAASMTRAAAERRKPIESSLPLDVEHRCNEPARTAGLSPRRERWSNVQTANNPLRGAAFVLAAHRVDQLPADTGAEVAFAGRSNAGKSSAIHALADQGALARTSKTPGRTQQLVVFALPDGRRLVDLPGYGYAKVPPGLRQHWKQEIDAYLRKRESLRGLVLIADIRHAPAAFDRQMLA